MFIRWEWSLGLLLISISIAIARKDASTSAPNNSKCPMLTECPFMAEQCAEDDDCPADSICCRSPCGKVCTKQLFTGCQTLRMAAARRAKALGLAERSMRMPRCSKSGGFEPIQCSNEIVSSCWCVDEAGFELPGTRAPAAALVNCTAPKPCADHTCRMFCPHGFSLTREGCPLCRCRDPCDGVRCPNSLECHLEDLACADPPCPPVPTCKRGRSLESICPVGDPLRISDTARPFLCGTDPGKPACPPMYQCLVQKGNDYGVCCPASLKIQKTGACPERGERSPDCGAMCSHDLECPSVQKCCETEQCSRSCVLPKNVTECTHQRALSELLALNEREGRGYVPQCGEDGQFKPKQCSRNGLVCWCVDRIGRKVRGSMGPAEGVNCSSANVHVHSTGRSLAELNRRCEAQECAAVCEYGFRLGDDGCPTCRCDDPCDGYTCPEDEECVNVKEASCAGPFCPTLPVCRPKAVYANPCAAGAPLTDDISGAPVACALRSEDGTVCPPAYECTAVAGSTQAVCCPREDEREAAENPNTAGPERPQTMCEYLHGFSESMEGTREGMNLALPPPSCDAQGDYTAAQCHRGECWCVDHFGTEIPKTRGAPAAAHNCTLLRETSECLDLTCRMGCEYGFVLSEETGCPLCQCRDPCSGVRCGESEQCQLVEVSCNDHYCPPVPACLPKKVGQCPYLVPATSTSCDFECSSDMACNGSKRCCSNGCGTQCTEPLLLTACQHQQILAQHRAHEAGTPLGRTFVPHCGEDGSFASRQCDPGTGECWCVDERGFEMSRTRTPNAALDCANGAPTLGAGCPALACEGECEHGFEIDRDGCRTCRCTDPCAGVACRGEGELCRLVAVECAGRPCPPVPMCLPKKENPCQSGAPLRLGGGGGGELATCGPEHEGCPSSHKCQLSPVGEYAVCCPKPRDVCFEPLDRGRCAGGAPRNLTRYRFNPQTNRCESFAYTGCGGNHNNFHTEDMCKLVCPVLSQCERLKEKNQRAAERYRKPTFVPRCEPDSGAWRAVQCLEHVGVCWCVSPRGEPLKGTLTRGAEPECNFRQARFRATNRADSREEDPLLDELMAQIGSFEDDAESRAGEDGSEVLSNWDVLSMTRCQALEGQCDADGKYLPEQCEQDVCWCVDEAGNQLAQTNTFRKGEHLCRNVPIETISVSLAFRGEFDDVSAVPILNQIERIVRILNGAFTDDGPEAVVQSDVLYVKFSLTGSNKVDVAYKLEQMVMHQRLSGLIADITRSRIVHKLQATPEDRAPDEPLGATALEHREIVSQSPVSVVAPYHTALIVTAAASTFVICVLTLLVILYRRKMINLHAKQPYEGSQPLSNGKRPIYIELPNEKFQTLPEQKT